MWTVNDVLAALPRRNFSPLPTPAYTGKREGQRIGLAVESMRRHTSDEGWQLFEGLEHSGYVLQGHGLPYAGTNVPDILDYWTCPEPPSTIVVQDKREWDANGTDFREPRAKFRNVGVLSGRDDIFKLTIIKDAHQRPEYHRESALELGCHAWICYYHPRIVCHLAPYVRQQHIVRTYHMVNPAIVPPYSYEHRQGALLSGALSTAYPLRQRLVQGLRLLPGVTYLPHPGYRRDGCYTPEYMKEFSKYRVAICTCSVCGYALRKIIEATACGCIVLTNLPSDEALPGIDGNLVRVHPDMATAQIANLMNALCEDYEPERQAHYAQVAKDVYNYRAVGSRLAHDIETMRASYPQPA